MCTNYRATREDLDHIAALTGVDVGMNFGEWKPDIWPDYAAPALIANGDGAKAILGVYGFWPNFLQRATWTTNGERAPSKRMLSTFNARGEEVGGKRLYASAWRAGNRCLIPAKYVVEPCWETGKNVWHRIGLLDWEPFAVAGIWRRYETEKGAVVGLSMLTVNADGHPVMGRMHRPADEKRSVVILKPSEYDEWLHSTNPEAMRSLVQLLPAARMIAEPLSK